MVCNDIEGKKEMRLGKARGGNFVIESNEEMNSSNESGWVIYY